jgi:GR25 family glycosyltransferase involved in LPS biosynthesis
MKSLNEYFNNIYLINLDKRPDKLQESLYELQKINTTAERISAIDGSLTFKKGMNLTAGAYGLMLTHIQILEDAIKNNYSSILLLEDDVMFVDGFMEKFESKINFLPNDWDMFYLGGNNIFELGTFIPVTGDLNVIINKHNYKQLNHELVKTTHTQTTHAVAINNKFLKTLFDYINNNSTLPVDNHQFLLQKMGYNAYVIMPSIALQRPTFSDIERRYVDYSNMGHNF